MTADKRSEKSRLFGRCCYRVSGRIRSFAVWHSPGLYLSRHTLPWPPKREFVPGRLRFRPDATRLLKGVGLPLAALFDAQLSRDPEIVELVEHGSGHVFNDGDTPYHCDGRTVLNRKYREIADEWPAVLAGGDLFVEWCDSCGYHFPSKHGRERAGLLDHLEETTLAGAQALRAARGAARVVTLRFEAVMRALRTGQLDAFGHRQNGELTSISAGIWSDPRTRISFNRNEVGRQNSVKPTRFDLLWFGVVVKAKQPPAEEAKASTSEQSECQQRDKGGKPPEYLWETAYDLLAIRLGNEGYPGSGKKIDLARMLLDCFQSIKGAKVPGEATAADWLRDFHSPVWNGVKQPVVKAPKKPPAK